VTPATAKSRIVRPSTGAFQTPTSMRPRARVVATPAMRSAGAPFRCRKLGFDDSSPVIGLDR
jgi:hypothetical protein